MQPDDSLCAAPGSNRDIAIVIPTDQRLASDEPALGEISEVFGGRCFAREAWLPAFVDHYLS